MVTYSRDLAEEVRDTGSNKSRQELERAINRVEVEAFNGNVNLAFLHAARKALEVL